MTEHRFDIRQYAKTFGTRMKLLRQHRGIKQYILADTIGKSASWVCDIENDRSNGSASPETVRAIADALGTSVQFLRLETDDPTPQKPA